MIVQGEHTFRAPRNTVWELLQDPEVLAKALPGGQDLRQTEDDKYVGKMNVGIGPVTAAKFDVTVQLKDKVAPERFAMEIDGRGKLGFTRGKATVELVDAKDGGTVMKYQAELQIGGKIASIGQRLLDSVSKMMTKNGLEALNHEIEARL